MAMNYNYSSEYYTQYDYYDFENTREDSSDDDASNYINNSYFSIQPTSNDSKNDDQVAAAEVFTKKVREFTTWLKKFERRSESHKLYLCGKNAINRAKEWLDDFGKSSVTLTLSSIDVIKQEQFYPMSDFIIIEVPSINVLIDKIPDFYNIKQMNIIVCCSDIKNCPKNKGSSFNLVFKRITLK
ncbi:hypothetical protein EIN_223500 [Entamoeba invadens IP1]|uniref:Uncharacterized protein n=1 Tax=Entamoeba invadens IP1 TaxID=370355 RepID=A0A0A1U263_ENTIV|nr:hypothetical protein EIN_223500 [Entamoeba invadens IP1]ELP88147.1 hypothetical protein EIN_223500 [Entamoeba invadens IP1]|eukprot:XP_004254918.1 hypothetical protein EIN_223500 [Entamoeba invadens IP1]